MNPSIKLSSLIRDGATGLAQAFGAYYVMDMEAPAGERKIIAACAIGGARIALGEKDSVISPHEGLFWKGPPMEGEFAQKQEEAPHGGPCPAGWHTCFCRAGEPTFSREGHHHLKSVVVHLNDCLRWDREKIATFIESYGY